MRMYAWTASAPDAAADTAPRDVLLDQILRIATRHERQEQDEIT